MISWSYYGERSWTYLFGEKYTLLYKLIFVSFTVISSVTSASTLLEFSDLLILAMALPNLLKAYLSKWKSGELDRECIRKGVCNPKQ
jgi:AGCS family alanine or glycine:cation symporter